MKALRRIIKITRIVFLILCGLLIMFFGTYIAKRLIHKNDPTLVCGIGFFDVETGSMEDEIMIGDLVVVIKRSSKKYQVGMDVTYVTSDMKKPTTHRIVNRDGDIITTRGIANNVDDAPIDVKDILGQVRFVWHGFDGFMAWLRSAYGILTIILGATLIFMTSTLIDKKIMNVENKNKDGKGGNISEN